MDPILSGWGPDDLRGVLIPSDRAGLIEWRLPSTRGMSVLAGRVAAPRFFACRGRLAMVAYVSHIIGLI